MTALASTSVHERAGPDIAGAGLVSSSFDRSRVAGKLLRSISSLRATSSFEANLPCSASSMALDAMETPCRAEIFATEFAKKLRGRTHE